MVLVRRVSLEGRALEHAHTCPYGFVFVISCFYSLAR
jgi:hypothetical protein